MGVIHKVSFLFTMLVVMAAILAGMPDSASCEPAVSITVSTTGDELNGDGDCSLREAVQAANSDSAVDACPAGSGADTIDLPAGIYTLTIGDKNEDGNAEGDLDISGAVSIVGSGANNTVVRAGTNPGDTIDRVFHVLSSGNLTVQDITIRNGGPQVGLGPNDGGAIYVEDGGLATINSCVITDNYGDNCGAIVGSAGSTVEISDSVISDNFGFSGGGGLCSKGTTTIDAVTFSNNRALMGGALEATGGPIQISNSTFSDNYTDDQFFGTEGYGGAIHNFAEMTINNCTFSGNSSLLEGGAIRNFGILSINGSTFSGNEAPNGGGILNLLNGQVSVTNSIIANSTGANCTGGITSLGYNIDSDGTCNLIATGDQPSTPPLLGPLQDNGGSTWTHALLTASPAIDAGDNSACLPTDQRGIARPSDGDDNGSEICDIGAFELVSPNAANLLRFEASPVASSTALFLFLPALLALFMHLVFKRCKQFGSNSY